MKTHALVALLLLAVPVASEAANERDHNGRRYRPPQNRRSRQPTMRTVLRPQLGLLRYKQQSNVVSPHHDPLMPHGEAVGLVGAIKKLLIGAERLGQALIAKYARVVPLTDSADLYTAKTLIDAQEMVGGLANSLSGSQPQVAQAIKSVLVPRLGTKLVLRLPAHQFLVNGKPGNRVLLYGGETTGRGPGHSEIDQLAHELDEEGMTLVKVMTHFDAAQGGTLMDIIKDGVSGMTHVGGYAAGYLKGKKVSVKSDWPSNYGILGDSNKDYNAHILAVDYQAGANKAIPKDHLRAYTQNYKLWDVITGLGVGFTNQDRIPEHSDYKNNPLEVYDQQSLNDMADVWGRMDRAEILSKGTFYCAEGRWTTANLAPNVLITKGRYAKVDALIEEFQKAPGVSPKTPEKGWEHLLRKGLISQNDYDGLVKTNRIAVYLDWVGPNIQPWKAFSPKQKDGLIADPMTLAGLVRGLLRAHFPREKVAATLTAELGRAHGEGGAVAKTIEGMLGGFAPGTPQGQVAAMGLGMKMASGALVAALENPQFKDMMLKKLGYQHITNTTDKQKVDAVYQEFIDALKDPSLDTRDKLDARLTQIDQRLAGMKVEMSVHDPVTLQRTSKKMVNFWNWAPPQSWVWWAQQPNLWNSHAVRYVATAMHHESAAPRSQTPSSPQE